MRNISTLSSGRTIIIRSGGFKHGSLAQAGCPPPTPLQNPQEGDTMSIAELENRPFEPAILDFYYKPTGKRHFCVKHFSVGELFGTSEQISEGTSGKSPKELMREYKKTLSGQEDHIGTSDEPDLRWIHLPFNSVQYAEEIIKMASKDHTTDEDFANKCILRQDRWMENAHRKRKMDGYHANYMGTLCSEIACDTKHSKEVEEDCCHRGANLVLIMPYLHWGKLDILKWRNEQITAIENNPKSMPESDGSETQRFYLKLMRDQLRSDTKPLHIRRTLDQFYHNYKRDTSKRDQDQIVSKYGKGGKYWELTESDGEQTATSDGQHQSSRSVRHKKYPDEEEKPESINSTGENNKHKDERTILLVDQLWLWVLGGKTLVTCFDRRWEKNNNPRSNVFDNVLWKLQKAGQDKRIKTPYDLANLIVDEASGFFFSSTDDNKDSPRFSELFHKAISETDDKQIGLFENFTKLGKHRLMELSSKQQDSLFDLSGEFQLFKEIRDIMDELNMVNRVYKEQLRILPALGHAQRHYALFKDQKTNALGHHNAACSEKMDETTGVPCTCGKDSCCLAKKNSISLKQNCNSDWEPLPEINFDPRDWFKRTSEYMEEHHAEIMEMIDEASRVSDALQDTIDLKQNSASIFEAHASRREGEAIMLFTVLSSIFLPLGFFTSFFGMNVAEINQGSNYSLHTALTVTLPISFGIFVLAMVCAFTRKVRTFIVDKLTFKRPAPGKLRQIWFKIGGKPQPLEGGR